MTIYFYCRFEDNEGSTYQVTALQMFKHGIKPAWEDEINHKGGEWRFDLQYLSDPEALQKVWEIMIFDMVTGNAPYIEEGIAGVRLVQKSK